MRFLPRWVLVVMVAALPAIAQEPVTWTAAVEPATVRPGEVVTLSLTATIEDGWHIYAAAQTEGGPVGTAFTPADTTPLEPLGGLREPAPEKHFDQGFRIDVLSHQGTVVFRQPFRVPADAQPGEVTVGGKVRFQACTDRSCLRPERLAVNATVTIEAGPARTEYLQPPPENAVNNTASPPMGKAVEPVKISGSAADDARAKGLLTFLLVAFAAGLAALLTPCVWPMVPITVSFFTKQAGDNPRVRVGLAWAYGTGIVVMYTGLGLILAATLGASSATRLAASPAMNLFFAALLIFFGISLFGVVNLQLPSGLVNYANRKGDSGGYAGALFMGLTLTLAAFTCTVQFVGGVLVWAANGEWLWPVLGMLSFSTAFALPFVILALFPQYLSSLPRSGGWLENSKIVLGFIEIAAAVKFISNVDLVWQWHILTRELVLGLWALVAFLIVLYLWGRLPVGHAEVPERLGRGRQWSGLMFLALSGYFLWGLTGARLGGVTEALLPPPDYTRDPSRQTASELDWRTDYDEALAEARAKGTNVFLDFTGVTCTNCRWMEQNIFNHPDVAPKLRRLTRARLYTDTGPHADRYQEMQVERYQTASLPFYAIVTPDGDTIATFDGLTRDHRQFAEFLDKGL